MKPRIQKWLPGTERLFVCFGRRPPYRYPCFGYGKTRAKAYLQWANSPVPF